MPLFNKRILTQNLTICEIPADHLQILQDWQGLFGLDDEEILIIEGGL